MTQIAFSITRMETLSAKLLLHIAPKGEHLQDLPDV
jgi:hypothetical protein